MTADAFHDARLDHADRDEMWDAARLLNPNMTEAEFEADWQEFVALKARKATQ